MSNLLQVYKNKEDSNTNITVRKTYLLGVDELYIEPGYNVRDIDPVHVEEFRDAYIAGENVPPLTVQVTEQGVKVIDGHHRWHGAKLAQEAGHEIRLECKDFVGNEAERIAFMVTSSQGRPLEPLERAAAYQRLKNQGWEPAEIAKKVKRSPSDIDQHLALLAAGDELIGMVKRNEVAATTAVALSREHGAKAGTIAAQGLAKAKASGKKKLTRTAAMPQFSATRARRLLELLQKAEYVQSEDVNCLYINDSVAFEVAAILEEYRSFIPAGASQPSTIAESHYEKNMLLPNAGNAVWPAEVNQLCSQLLDGKELSSEMVQKVKTEINRKLLEKISVEDIQLIVSEMVVSMEAQA